MQMDAVDVGVRKRKLDESSTAQHDYDRFAKRFNLLNLGMSRKLLLLLAGWLADMIISQRPAHMAATPVAPTISPFRAH